MPTHRYIYHGRVQGVGFRYTTASIARGHRVTGYVKNLRDGTVELVVAGEDGVVAAFLEEIATALEGNISEREEQPAPGGESFSGFDVRY